MRGEREGSQTGRETVTVAHPTERGATCCTTAGAH